jgi:hypothetical protein
MMVDSTNNSWKPRYNFKAYSSAYTDAWETDANIIFEICWSSINEGREALNELDQTPAAILLLNQIRTRAELGNTAASKAEVRTAIWKERRVEMAFEHDRFTI